MMSLSAYLAHVVTDYSNTQSYASRLRAKRSLPLIRLIDEAFARKGAVSILDIGGTRNYWRIMRDGYLEARRVEITTLNLPGDPSATPPDPLFRYAYGDACELDEYEDGSVDIVHSNSVLEHVGDWERMQRFANETRRVGRAYFVQTPSYWFPMEPHALTIGVHWLPRPLRAHLLMRRDLGNWPRSRDIGEAMARIDSARLLGMGAFRYLFPDATEIITERMLGWPKSMVAVRRARVREDLV